MNDEELKQKIQAVTDSYAKFCNKKFGTKLDIPVNVSFNLEETRPSCGGLAISNTNGELKLSFNFTMLRKNISEFLNQVIPHEIAHLVVDYKFFTKGIKTEGNSHGYEWCSVMENLGKQPKVYHSMSDKESKQFYKDFKKKKKIDKSVL